MNKTDMSLSGVLIALLILTVAIVAIMSSPKPGSTYVPLTTVEMNTLESQSINQDLPQIEASLEEAITIAMDQRVDVYVFNHKYVEITTTDNTFDLQTISQEEYQTVKENMIILSLQVQDILGEGVAVVFTTYDMQQTPIFFIYEGVVVKDIKQGY